MQTDREIDVISQLPNIYLARHGETAWTITGQHTGRADIPLTERGERDARRLGERLKGQAFPRVYTSPLQRASRTCELAGFLTGAIVDPDLMEWNYGDYEGRTRVEIRKERPDWTIFRDGCPNGETIAEVGARADRVIARLREWNADALLFSSGHFLRFLAARWCGFEPAGAAHFSLSTAALSELGYEHDLSAPVIMKWNDNSHTGA